MEMDNWSMKRDGGMTSKSEAVGRPSTDYFMIGIRMSCISKGSKSN